MRKLPIGKTIGHMLASTYNNIGFALRAQWPWMAILVAANFLLPLAAGVPLNLPDEQMEQMFKVDPSLVARYIIFVFAIVLIWALAFSSIAVNWHRYILLSEVPKGIRKLRLDSSVWRYFGTVLLICLILIPVLMPAIFLGNAFLPAYFSIWMLIYVVLVAIPLVNRLSIKLPAVALGRHDFGFSDAMKTSAQNWWQLVVIGFVVSAISLILGIMLPLPAFSFIITLGQNAGMWFDVIVRAGVNWFMLVMGITFFTSLYGFFVEKRDF